MPAHLRYSGWLYQSAGSKIQRAVKAGKHILIVSGGYGLLRAEEPIGHYDKKFALRDWPPDLLAKCILDYASNSAIRDVIAVMSASSPYARLMQRVPWKSARLSAKLVCPVNKGGPAQVKVPRAQGEAIAELLTRGLNQNWRSSDNLKLRVSQL
jgi:hypothetical protein